MNDIRGLLKQGSHYAAGRLGSMVLGLVSFTIFVRLLTLADYGVLNLALRVAMFATLFAKAGLQNSVWRFHKSCALAGDSRSLSRLYSTILFGTAAQSVLVCVTFMALITVIPAGWLTESIRKPLLWAAFTIPIRSLQSVLWGFLRVEGQSKVFNVLDIAVRAGAIACAAIVTHETAGGATSVIVGIVLAEGAVVIPLAFVRARQHDYLKQFDGSYLRALLEYSAPLIGSEIAGILLDSGDRLLVQYYLGPEPLGTYAAAYAISNYIEDAILAPIALVLPPYYMQIWAEKGNAETSSFLSKAFSWYTILICGIAAVAASAGSDLALVIGTKKLRSAGDLLPVLIVALLIASTQVFFNAGLLIYKKTRLISTEVALAAIVNLTLNTLLLPRLGLSGAAIASLLSFAWLVGRLLRQSQRHLTLSIDWLAGARHAALAAAVAVVMRHTVTVSGPLLAVVLRSSGAMCLYCVGIFLTSAEVRPAGRAMLQAMEPNRYLKRLRTTLSGITSGAKGQPSGGSR